LTVGFLKAKAPPSRKEREKDGAPSERPHHLNGTAASIVAYSRLRTQTDGSDITGLGFVSAGPPGKFGFEIDEVEIK